MTQYPSVRIEGGVLGSDVLDELVSASLPGQKAADFRLSSSRNLTDEIALTFADARSLWDVFQRRLERLLPDDLATSVTRDAWMIPFLGLFGFELSFNNRAFDRDGMSFAISHRSGESDVDPPVHIVGYRQSLGRVPKSGRPRMAPHTLVQEFLNRDDRLWGVVTNGQTIRLLRDCTFVRRQAYIEFDLAGILEEKRFQDFSLLYRLLHRTRFPSEDVPANDCLLEKYYEHSEQQGGRVRHHLREGVEDCITLLANGFLRHADNSELRHRVSPRCSEGTRISDDELYRELLTLIYRFLFLMVSEDRGDLSSNPLYLEHYGISRLRRYLDQHSSLTDHDDIWQSLRVLWLVLIKDEPHPSLGGKTMASVLGLPVLNGDLFAPQFLDQCTISNADLLEAFWHLAWYQESQKSPPRRVNYAALDVEELGSVYESLLELHPYIEHRHGNQAVFDFSKGGGRKETGSYYTPPSLVAELVQSALEPVLADRLSQCRSDEERRKAILSIRVCDPACGSGHFMLAAARRLGKELARVVTGEDEPAPERVRECIREVISHCIYGVDRNPLAVDLCRVALWLESHTADKPLTFLDHRIRVGDSLIGVFDLTSLREGIPDKAFAPLQGDNKAYARETSRRNRDERTGAANLSTLDLSVLSSELDVHSREVDAVADDSPEAIRRKKKLFEDSHKDPQWRRQKNACDLWTAAFFQPLQPDRPTITTAMLDAFVEGKQIDAQVLALANGTSFRRRFFHWPLEFPEVFSDGGFDVVLSNPPWERLKLQEQEFFGPRDARIADAPNKAARAKLIRLLPKTNPSLHDEYVAEVRASNASSSFMRESGRYPLCGRGDINTYTVFSELCRNAVHGAGRVGIVVPSGIAFADTTKDFFDDIISTSSLVSLFSFFEIRKFFPATDSRDPFCLLTLTSTSSSSANTASFVFNAKAVVDIRDESKLFVLTGTEIELLNPNTKTCPIFQSRKDAELTKAIYRRVPVLWRESRSDQPDVNPWRLSFKTLFHMANDSHHFRTAEELSDDGYVLEGNAFVSPYDRYLPLYEAKMLHQFDHRWATYESERDSRDVTSEEKKDPSFVVQPRYWVREEIVESVMPRYPESLALAIKLKHGPSIARILNWWAAGFHLSNDQANFADKLLVVDPVDERDASIERQLGEGTAEVIGRRLNAAYPLMAEDVDRIVRQRERPLDIAADLVDRFSPKWFIGWRDICRSTDERTLIASATPRVAVGHTFPLILPFAATDNDRLFLLACLNSLVVDYSCRQKVGGTHITYSLIKQFPVLPPADYQFRERITRAARKLVNSNCEIHAGDEEHIFEWHDDRRFELRCEIDAAFMHLYLSSVNSGEWRNVQEESAQQLDALTQQFPKPRDAVAFILDQFPLIERKDNNNFGRYRTKERILEIYDAMLASELKRID